MKKIQALIEELNFKKEKIEFLEVILQSVKDYENVTEKVRDDVHELLTNFVEKTVAEIESGASPEANIQKSESLTQEEIDAVRAITKRVKQKQTDNQTPQQNVAEQPAGQMPQQELGPNEKMAFALQHRSLADKDVLVVVPGSDGVKGKVTGLDAPYVCVKLPDERIIKVPIDKVSLMS